VASGDVADGISHCQHGQSERQGDTEQTYAHIGEQGRENGGATPAEHQPKRANEFCHCPFC
jgi:hypothetical protein